MHRFDAMLMVAMALPLVFCIFCQLYNFRLVIAAAANRQILWRAPRFVPDTAATSEPPIAPCSTVEHLPRLLVIIPAHNEELLLGSTLDSVANINYHAGKTVTLVIADNCSDATAEIAAQHRAFVVVRTDPGRKGKGYALQDITDVLLNAASGGSITLDQRVSDFTPEAAVFLDADSIVHRDILLAFAAGLQQGDEALQACYGVRNAHESLRTRLMTCALALIHLAKPAGRERLGLSDGLKGNGFCLTRRVMEAVPWRGDSITEDIEHTLRLCEGGYRIGFVPDALVWAQMPSGGAAAGSQRRRWESGRYHLLRTRVPALLATAVRRKDGKLLDRVIELIVPPFADLAAIQIVLLAASVLVVLHTGWHMAIVISGLWFGLLLIQATCLLTAMWLARLPGTHFRLFAVCACIYGLEANGTGWTAGY